MPAKFSEIICINRIVVENFEYQDIEIWIQKGNNISALVLLHNLYVHILKYDGFFRNMTDSSVVVFFFA